MTDSNKIEWNYALGDLDLIGQIERNAIEAYVGNDVSLYFKWIKAYFHKLSSMVNFERPGFLERFRDIQSRIWGNSEENSEEDNLALHGQALEELEQIYCELTEIKVNAGLSVDPREDKSAKRKMLEEKYKGKFPIFDMK